MHQKKRSSGGFSLIEVLISLVLAVGMMAATSALLKNSLDLVDTTTLLGEMNQNARVGINLLSKDLSVAGAGIRFIGAVQLPDGKGASASRYACDEQDCHVANGLFADRRLYPITPGPNKGPEVGGNQTDAVTLMYRDAESRLDQYFLVKMTPSGSQIEFDSRTSPRPDDPIRGIKEGDVLIVHNVNGSAAAVATSVQGFRVNLAANDPLGFNQPSAEHGNVASLANEGTNVYPETSAFKISLVSYFLEADAPTDVRRLMRHVGARPPLAVAENVADFQVTYDIFDDSGGGVTTSDLDDAGGKPNLIRKINLRLVVRAPRRGSSGKRYDYAVLQTSVSARNLAFLDRYQ